MGLTYEKTETEDKIIFKFTRLPLMYIATFAFFPALILLLYFSSISSGFIFPFVLVLLAIVLFTSTDYRLARNEINQARREGKKVSHSGSRYSFSDPYTVEISKK